MFGKQISLFGLLEIPSTGASVDFANPMFISNPVNSRIITSISPNALRTNRFFNTDAAFVKNLRWLANSRSG